MTEFIKPNVQQDKQLQLNGTMDLTRVTRGFLFAVNHCNVDWSKREREKQIFLRI